MTNPQQLTYSYYALALCVIASTVPQMAVQTFSMALSILLIIAFYILRSKKEKDSVEHQESSSLIKTFWIWSAAYVGGVMVAGALISSFGDMTAMNEWTESVVQGTASLDENSMEQVTQQFMETNFSLIISLTVICILPAQIYAALRIKQGLARLKNQATTPPEALIG